MGKTAFTNTRSWLRSRRHFRVRKKVNGTSERPRLVIYRSLKHIYAQLVDDVSQRTLMTVTDSGLEGKKVEKSAEVGKRIAQKAKDAGVTRSIRPCGYKYQALKRGRGHSEVWSLENG